MRREEFAADLAKRAAENTGWQVSTILAKYPIPEQLNRKLLRLSGIPEELKGSQFSGEMRAALVTNCTEFPFPVERLGDFAVAMATRGGVALEQVNPKTMESKLVPGLFFPGRCSISTATPAAIISRPRSRPGTVRRWGSARERKHQAGRVRGKLKKS